MVSEGSNVTRMSLAQASDMSATSFENALSGKRAFTVAQVIRIGATLGVEPATLLPRKVAPLKHDPETVTRDAIDQIEASKVLAYSMDGLAAACGVSKWTIEQAKDSGDLVPSYPNSKPIITRSEAIRWLESLPNEPPQKAAS